MKYRRYKAIAEAISARIQAGDYKLGDRIPSERDLVDEYGVSRPTIREALIALEIMGCVEVRGGSGIYVTDAATFTGSQDPGIGPFELLEARKIFESNAAAIAAQSITAKQLSALRRNLERQIGRRESGQPFLERDDMRFHMIIAEATGNGAILHVVEQLWRIRSRSDIWRIMDERLDLSALEWRAVEDHIRIYASIEARDRDAAFKAMSAHMQNNIEWRLRDPAKLSSISERDRLTKLRLLLDHEMAKSR